jgi:hypothetical protein
VRLRSAQRLLPAAFALHVLEEAPGFTDWARRHASSRYTQRDFVLNNALGLAFTGAATAAVTRVESRPAFVAWWSLVLTQQALFNTAFHAGTTVAWRERSPGLVTSAALFLPLWAHVTRLALRRALLTRRSALAGAAVGGAVHAAAVAQQVFRVGRS